MDDYSSELFSLKLKTLNIRKSVCDLDDVIGMIQASTEIQEQKMDRAIRTKRDQLWGNLLERAQALRDCVSCIVMSLEYLLRRL